MQSQCITLATSVIGKQVNNCRMQTILDCNNDYYSYTEIIIIITRHTYIC